MWTDQDEQRTVRLAFDDFGWEIVREAARERGWAMGELVSDACLDFGDRLFEGAFSCEAPTFRERGGTGRNVPVAIPRRLWADIQMEAGRQDVEVEALIEHALMLRLAGREGQVRRSPSMATRRAPRRWAG